MLLKTTQCLLLTLPKHTCSNEPIEHELATYCTHQYPTSDTTLKLKAFRTSSDLNLGYRRHVLLATHRFPFFYDMLQTYFWNCLHASECILSKVWCLDGVYYRCTITPWNCLTMQNILVKGAVVQIHPRWFPHCKQYHCGWIVLPTQWAIKTFCLTQGHIYNRLQNYGSYRHGFQSHDQAAMLFQYTHPSGQIVV